MRAQLRCGSTLTDDVFMLDEQEKDDFKSILRYRSLFYLRPDTDKYYKIWQKKKKFCSGIIPIKQNQEVVEVHF